MMKVKTLVNALMMGFDEVEWYDNNMNLVSRMSPETLISEYGDCKVKKFAIYESEDLTTLELVF